ncbi:MAG: hypothetical protein ACSLE9_04590 [Burkholderiaceae bacterium]
MMKQSLLAAVCVSALLAACGGGGDDTPAVTAQVPPAASKSSVAFMAYLQELVVASADTLEPVDVTDVTPPADETGDPVAVN